MASNPFTSTLFVGQNRIWFSSLESTNETAFSLALSKSLPEGSLVVTNEQKAGRGQQNRKWQSNPSENFTGSLVLKPSFLRPDQGFKLNMMASLALIDLCCHYGIEAKIKWPNDVLIGNRKLSGLLAENRISGKSILFTVLGIGLNVNQDFRSNQLQATSLFQELGERFELQNVEADLMQAIERRYIQLRRGDNFEEEYLSEFVDTSLLRGNLDGKVGEVKILGINPNGEISIELDGEPFENLQYGRFRLQLA